MAATGGDDGAGGQPLRQNPDAQHYLALQPALGCRGGIVRLGIAGVAANLKWAAAE
jgi:hypothetical protein